MLDAMMRILQDCRMANKKQFRYPKKAAGVSLHPEVFDRVKAMADESKLPLSYYFERAITARYAKDLWDEVDAFVPIPRKKAA